MNWRSNLKKLFIWKNKKTEHDYSLDILRGWAVFMMLLSHTVFFFYEGENRFMELIKLWGDTFCFTVFLFVAGAVSFIAYLSGEEAWKKSWGRLCRRTLIITAGYYFVALVSLSRNFLEFNFAQKLNLLAEIITLQRVASFVEFILPLVFLRFSLLFGRKFYNFLLEKPWRLLFGGLISYLLGIWLYSFSFPEFLISWKALLVGESGWYTFPVLLYFPIFTGGIFWARISSAWRKMDLKHRWSAWIGGLFTLISVVIFVIHSTGLTTGPAMLNRWPPNPFFLIIGLALVMVLISVIIFLREIFWADWFLAFFYDLGKKAFSLFITHSCLLHLYRNFNGPYLSGIGEMIVAFLLLFLTSYGLSSIQWQVYSWFQVFVRQKLSWFFSVSSKDFSFWKNKKLNYSLTFRAQLILLFFLLFVLFSIVALDEQTVDFIEPDWWDDHYAYHREIKIQNRSGLEPFPAGTEVSFSLDHESLADSGKSQLGGQDLALVHWNGEKFANVSFRVAGELNSSSIFLIWKLEEDLLPGKTDHSYYLYYGYPQSEKEVISVASFSEMSSDLVVSLAEEKSHPFLFSLSQRWVLKEDGFSLDNDQLQVRVNLDHFSDDDRVSATYQVVNTDFSGELTQRKDSYLFETVDFSSLPTGNYEIQAEVEDRGRTFVSQKESFFVSYPLYVVWSIDWEGYDVTATSLDFMAQTSADHDLPITHFFNPRIYVNDDISISRRDFLSNWIKERRDEYGDEIGLHLHMFHDFVRDAGVKVRFLPNWSNWADGYDVLMSAYSFTETVQLLERGLYWFGENGLGRPVSFRAGGWYADEETLRAVESVGFQIDSSGREAYIWGKNQVAGFWDLKSDTQPYRPGVDNQNQGEIPFMDLWEFPNNGGSSYDLSVAQMQDNFYDQWGEEFLFESRVITYLTHPQWLSLEERQRVESLFEYLDNFRYDLGKGPVRYATLEQIYPVFAQ